MHRVSVTNFRYCRRLIRSFSEPSSPTTAAQLRPGSTSSSIINLLRGSNGVLCASFLLFASPIALCCQTVRFVESYLLAQSQHLWRFCGLVMWHGMLATAALSTCFHMFCPVALPWCRWSMHLMPYRVLEWSTAPHPCAFFDISQNKSVQNFFHAPKENAWETNTPGSVCVCVVVYQHVMLGMESLWFITRFRLEAILAFARVALNFFVEGKKHEASYNRPH